MTRLLPNVAIGYRTSEHLNILQRGGSAALPVQMRLRQVPVEEVGTTVINYEEQMRGWLVEAARANTPTRVRDAYVLLEEHIANFHDLKVLPFGAEPSDQFGLLRQAKIRIGTKDLRIAAICLANGSTLLTRNLRHFEQVPNLKAEDWSG